MTDSRRQLPSVDRLLRDAEIETLLRTVPRGAVVTAAREAIAAARTRRAEPEDWAAEIRERLSERRRPSLHPVLNATGVVLHTNLGARRWPRPRSTRSSPSPRGTAISSSTSALAAAAAAQNIAGRCSRKRPAPATHWW